MLVLENNHVYIAYECATNTSEGRIHGVYTTRRDAHLALNRVIKNEAKRYRDGIREAEGILGGPITAIDINKIESRILENLGHLAVLKQRVKGKAILKIRL